MCCQVGLEVGTFAASLPVSESVARILHRSAADALLPSDSRIPLPTSSFSAAPLHRLVSVVFRSMHKRPTTARATSPEPKVPDRSIIAALVSSMAPRRGLIRVKPVERSPRRDGLACLDQGQTVTVQIPQKANLKYQERKRRRKQGVSRKRLRI